MPQNGKLGKPAAKPLRSGTVKFKDIAGSTTITFPTPFGHASGEAKYSKMFGNGPDDSVFPGFQGAGDCTIAGPANSITEDAVTKAQASAVNGIAEEPVIPNISGKTCIAHYSQLTKEANGTAYDPETGQGDTGLDPQQVLAWRQSEGFTDDDGNVHKIGPYVALETGNFQQLLEAAYVFTDVGIGIVFTQNLDDEFTSGHWNYVAGSPEEGGHWIEGMGHPSADSAAIISWEKRVVFAQKLYEKQSDEAFAWLSNERYNEVTGEQINSYTEADLEKYLAMFGQVHAAA